MGPEGCRPFVETLGAVFGHQFRFGAASCANTGDGLSARPLGDHTRRHAVGVKAVEIAVLDEDLIAAIGVGGDDRRRESFPSLDKDQFQTVTQDMIAGTGIPRSLPDPAGRGRAIPPPHARKRPRFGPRYLVQVHPHPEVDGAGHGQKPGAHGIEDAVPVMAGDAPLHGTTIEMFQDLQSPALGIEAHQAQAIRQHVRIGGGREMLPAEAPDDARGPALHQVDMIAIGGPYRREEAAVAFHRKDSGKMGQGQDNRHGPKDEAGEPKFPMGEKVARTRRRVLDHGPIIPSAGIKIHGWRGKFPRDRAARPRPMVPPEAPTGVKFLGSDCRLRIGRGSWLHAPGGGHLRGVEARSVFGDPWVSRRAPGPGCV